MPEIAEVEHARRECERYCLSQTITTIETVSDDLIFVGMPHDEFAKTLKGRTVVDTKRWGKYFVLMFDQGPHLVGHFGMTGDLKFRHLQKPDQPWPPRFWKAVMTFGTNQVAFCDARRLGRLRLVSGDPLSCEPISKLGFDPLHNLPNSDDFATMVGKRGVPIKALLLDQAFSAGVGNWIADEILYHARLHPAQYANSLTRQECDTLRQQMEKVCRIAVEAEADESLLPEDWLMTYRWNKGKGKGAGVLPNGHKLAFETVGGRTSAFAPALQKLRGSIKKAVVRKRAVKVEQVDEIDGGDKKRTRQTRSAATKVKTEKDTTNNKTRSTATKVKTEKDTTNNKTRSTATKVKTEKDTTNNKTRSVKLETVETTPRRTTRSTKK